MARPREFDLETVLFKAMRVFVRKGYEGTSISELAREMGMCRSSVYNAFGDKRGVYLEAIKCNIRYEKRERHEIFQQASTPLEGLRHFLDRLVLDLVEDSDLHISFSRHSTWGYGPVPSDVSRLSLDWKQEYLRFFASVFEDMQRRGEARADQSPRDSALFLYTLQTGLCNAALTLPAEDLKRVADGYLAWVLA